MQELSGGGEPVHHRVSILRDAPAQARAAHRAPRRSGRPVQALQARAPHRQSRPPTRPRQGPAAQGIVAAPGQAAQWRDPRHPRRGAWTALRDDGARRAVLRAVALARVLRGVGLRDHRGRRRSMALPHGRVPQRRHGRAVRRGARHRPVRLAHRAPPWPDRRRAALPALRAGRARRCGRDRRRVARVRLARRGARAAVRLARARPARAARRRRRRR